MMASQVSQTFTITGEPLTSSSWGKTSTKVVPKYCVKPPVVNKDGSCSLAQTFCLPWQHWAFNKIGEPVYDSLSTITGVISNTPELISEHHMISVMRVVEAYLEPKYSAYISTKTNGVFSGGNQ
jgi:hypothetical protein